MDIKRTIIILIVFRNMKHLLLSMLALSVLVQAANLRNEGPGAQPALLQAGTSLPHKGAYGPCLPNTDLGGNKKDETHAQRARKQLSVGVPFC